MVYISEVLLPSADIATNTLFDSSNLSKLDIQVQRLDRIANQIAYHSGSIYYLPFYIPNDSNFFCTEDNYIAYTLKLTSTDNPKPCLTGDNTPTNPTENCCYSYNGFIHCSKKITNSYIWNCTQNPQLFIKGPFSGILILQTLSAGSVSVTIQEG